MVEGGVGGIWHLALAQGWHSFDQAFKVTNRAGEGPQLAFLCCKRVMRICA